MSEQTTIEWATHSWNPWEGCTKVSPGCANCYAEARNKRFSGGANWGKGKPRRRTSPATWRNPLKWNREAEMSEAMSAHEPNEEPIFTHTRPRIFPSLCDWLDDEVPIEWLADFLKLIHDTPNLNWLLLTKRPENFTRRVGSLLSTMFLRDDWRLLWVEGKQAPANVWIGTSVEDQKRADERIPELLKIPAKVRFLSVEPLLGDVDLAYTCFNGADSFGSMPGIHWVIVGGESGPGARPCNVAWIRSIVGQCKAAGVPCFVKQLGSQPRCQNIIGEPPWGELNLKHKKGGDMTEWPEDLRVREFPKL